MIAPFTWTESSIVAGVAAARHVLCESAWKRISAPAGAPLGTWYLPLRHAAPRLLLPRPALAHDLDLARALGVSHPLRAFLFHLRQALLQRGHEVYDRRSFLGLLDRRYLFVLQVRLDQLLHV